MSTKKRPAGRVLKFAVGTALLVGSSGTIACEDDATINETYEEPMINEPAEDDTVNEPAPEPEREPETSNEPAPEAPPAGETPEAD